MAKKILVVDDDPVIVRYLENVFTDNGYETKTAADGVAALEALEADKPDLITLDLEMPNEWGTRFYRKFSKDKRFADIPVIVISGLAGRELAIKNVVAAIAKPFDPDKVIALVRKTIGDPEDAGR